MKKIIIGSILLGVLILNPSISLAADDGLCPNIKNVLKVKMEDKNSNGEVTALQSFLKEKGFLDVNPTGYFGAKTESALKKYQATIGVSTTGATGPLTRAKISTESCSGIIPTGSNVSSKSSEISIPAISIKATPVTTVTASSTILETTITWNASNSFECSASGAWSGIKKLSGTEVVRSDLSDSKTKRFTMLCEGTAGTITKTVTVNVDGGGPVTKPVTPTIAQSNTVANPTTTPPAPTSQSTTTILSSVASILNQITGTKLVDYTFPTSYSGPVPSCNVSTESRRVTVGQPFLINWSSSNADIVTGVIGTDKYPANGSQYVTVWNTGSHIYNLSFYGKGGKTNCSFSVVAGDSFGNFAQTSGPASPVYGTYYGGGSGGSGGGSVSISGSSGSGQSSTGSSSAGGSSVTSVSSTNTGGTGITNVTSTGTVSSSQIPTVSFNASQNLISEGESVALSWNVTGATSCMMQYDLGESSIPFSGSKIVSPLLSTTYRVVCTNASSANRNSMIVSKSATVSVAPRTTTTASMTSSCTYSSNDRSESRTAPVSQSSTQNACRTACTNIRNSVFGTSDSGICTFRDLSGAFSIMTIAPVVGGTTIATGGTGITVTTDSTVTTVPVPTLNFSVSSTNVDYNGAVNLNWSATNVTSCTLNGTPKATSVSESSGPLTANRTFVLNCVGAGGNISRSLTVNVGSNPALNIDPTKPISLNFRVRDSVGTVGVNQPFTLAWDSVNVSSCTASGDWSGVQSLNGASTIVQATPRTYSYTLSCRNSFSSVSKTVNVQVANGVPIVNATSTVINNAVTATYSPVIDVFTISPATYHLDNPATTTMTWRTTNATYCSMRTHVVERQPQGELNPPLSVIQAVARQNRSGSVVFPRLTYPVGPQKFIIVCSGNDKVVQKDFTIQVVR